MSWHHIWLIGLEGKRRLRKKMRMNRKRYHNFYYFVWLILFPSVTFYATSKSPPKVKAFIWVPLQNRILTQEILTKREWQIEPHYGHCDQQKKTETIFFGLGQYAQTIWRGLTMRIVFSTLLPLEDPKFLLIEK